MSTHCEARQHSDQMVCGLCGLAWDVNDPYPPTCAKTNMPGRASGAPPAERRSESRKFHTGGMLPVDAAPAVTQTGKAAIREALEKLRPATEAVQYMPANPGQRKPNKKE